jgi:hypothetical protein
MNTRSAHECAMFSVQGFCATDDRKPLGSHDISDCHEEISKNPQHGAAACDFIPAS